MIDRDRKCHGCGYNLRGLRAGGVCPECGLPMHMPGNIDDPLSRMPLPVIRTFQVAAITATGCTLGVVAVILGAVKFNLSGEVATALLLGISMIWFGATWLLTPGFDLPQAVYYGFAHAGRLRHGARLLQLGWIVAAAALLIDTTASKAIGNLGLGPVVSAARWGGGTVGLAGLVALSAVLYNLSEWVRDDFARKQFNWTLWFVPLFTILWLIKLPIPPLRIIVPLLWFGSLMTFPIGLLSLSRTISFSAIHAGEYSDQLRRQQEKIAQQRREAADRVAGIDAARERRMKKQQTPERGDEKSRS